MMMFNLRNYLSSLIWAILIAFYCGGAQAEEPAALIEDISGAPDAGVEFMDYVYPGQVIDLGNAGVLTLNYFSSCRTEVINTGKTTIGTTQSAVAGGQINASTTDCQQSAAIVTADATEAGAAVLRVTPFGEDNWQETSIKSTLPIFKWSSNTPGVKITITSVDEQTPTEILSQTTDKTYLAYPADGPKLQAGKPYVVKVVTNEVVQIKTIKKTGRQEKEVIEDVPLVFGAVFSIDPGMDIDDNVANRTIRLIQG